MLGLGGWAGLFREAADVGVGREQLELSAEIRGFIF